MRYCYIVRVYDADGLLTISPDYYFTRKQGERAFNCWCRPAGGRKELNRCPVSNTEDETTIRFRGVRPVQS